MTGHHADYPSLAAYIGGSWEELGGHAVSVTDPASGQTLATFRRGEATDIERAANASAQAFAEWRRMPPKERSVIMKLAASNLIDRKERIASIMTQEQGKVLAEARLEVQLAIDTVEWFAEEAKRAYGRVVPARSDGTLQLVVQEPIGPVAAFTPWNFPCSTPARKIAAALAAGCTMVIRASEETPATCQELVRAFHDAGLPPGVLNFIFGPAALTSETLLAGPHIRKLSFTGSVEVGRLLGELAARHLKRSTMELGGQAPVIVFDDADIEVAVRQLVAGKFRNAGQICTSPARFFVQRRVLADFTDAFVARTRAMQVGPGLVEGSDMGPLCNRRAVADMESFVRDATATGAELLTGGEAVRIGDGSFFAPTVLAEVAGTARVMQEETFGPIAPIVAFDAFEEAIERANSLPFGLAAYLFTRSERTATAASHAIEAGLVGVNGLAIANPETPFGGVKQSGHGYESGIEGLEAYTHRKMISRQ
jgi:succinate-semialdehyde dehydrogenase / glutarate-semialdehyde dehydrogenase